jgi:hypothetical protein
VASWGAIGESKKGEFPELEEDERVGRGVFNPPWAVKVMKKVLGAESYSERLK